MILGLDAAGTTAVAALIQPDGHVQSRARRHPARGEMLPDLIDEVMAAAGARTCDLSGIACGVGPGSFTGVRVALALAHGLALPKRLPLRGCSSLSALAGALEGLVPHARKRHRLVIVDAQRGECFVLHLPPGEPPTAGIGRDVRIRNEFLPSILPTGIDFVLVRDGCSMESFGCSTVFEVSDLADAAWVAKLAFGSSEAVPALPNYLREAAADENRLASSLPCSEPALGPGSSEF